MKYYIMIAIIALLILYIIKTYNTLIKLSKMVDKAFASIDVVLIKRYDLIPNIVAAVKEYMEHEKELLENIVALRSRAIKKDLTTGEKIDIDNKMTSMLSALNVQIENYPDLKANQNVLQLQDSLEEVENLIANARNYYNDVAGEYNIRIAVIPDLIIARLFGFNAKALYTATEEQRENVDVKELFDK